MAGCQIVYMPDLVSLAAGCVVQELRMTEQVYSVPWLKAVEKKLFSLGCRHSRVYQQYSHGGLERLLLDHGYRRIVEIALLNMLDTDPREPCCAGETKLHLVITEEDWSRKLAVHLSLRDGPDGHSSPAANWIDMERRKCEAGYMEPYLVMHEGHVCGAVNLALSERIARLKNLVIAPPWRRNGVGVDAARQIAHLAWKRKRVAAGCFAIANAPSLSLYQKAGFRPVGSQIEWFKRLR